MSDQEGNLKPRLITLRTDAREHSAPGKGRTVGTFTIKYGEELQSIVRSKREKLIHTSVP